MSTYIIVLVFCVLCFTDLFGVGSLNAGDQGVCIVKTSSQKTRVKTVAVVTKKMCGRKRCVVRRTRKETYTVSSNRTVCCKGWEYRSEDDSCSPQCSTGCIGGRCIAPDVCHCDPPSVLEEEHKNICIAPICDPPCVNGLCVANNTCECAANFDCYNTTHCYRCDPGYAIDDNLTCHPVCTKDCVNGNCIGPNICGCRSSYRLSEDNVTCEPICDTSCANSTCTAPNICTCLPGYVNVNNACVPHCDLCNNGQCVGPNVCACNAGYKTIDGVCKPICKVKCVNGYCSKPNTCTCNKGYVKNNTSDICHKLCPKQCKGACDTHGKCTYKVKSQR